MSDATQPFHDGAEQAILAHLIHYPDEQPRLADLIQDRMFYIERHQLIWRAMGDIATDAGPDEINLHSLEVALGGEKFKQIGGFAYLAGLDLQLPDTGKIDSLAEVVRELYVRRQVIERCSRIAADGYGSDVATDSLLSALSSTAADLEKDRAADEYEDMAGLAQRLDLDAEPREFLGIRTGLNAWDRKTLGLQPGHLDIIAARTSHGKSALMLLAALAAAQDNKKVAIESLEMSKKEIVTRAISILSQVPLKAIKTRRMSLRHKDLAKRTRFALFSFEISVSDKSTRTVEQICASARRRKLKHGLDLLMIDYLGQLQSAERIDNVPLRYKHMTGMLKRLAKDLEIPVVLLHQINREGDGSIPQLKHLEWSSAVEQDADQVTFIHRPWVNSRKDEDIGKTSIVVAKNRDGETGMVPAYFDAETVTFRGLDQHEQQAASHW